MAEFKFLRTEKNGLFQYQLPSDQAGFFEQSLFNLVYQYPIDDRRDLIEQFAEYGIHYAANEENSFLYTQLLHHLYEQNPQPILCIIFGNPESFSNFNSLYNFQKIEWRYSIEYTVDNDLCQDFGFLHPKQFLDSVDYYNKSLSDRYFYLAEAEPDYFNKFIYHFQADVSNWVFISTDHLHPIRELLAKEQTIDPAIFFEQIDWQLNLQIGEDEGYLDYILLQSKRDLKQEIQYFERKAKRFIRDTNTYLKELKEQDKLEEWEDLYNTIAYFIHLHFPNQF